MKLKNILSSIGSLLFASTAQPANISEMPKSIYDYSFVTLAGDTVSMSDFKGKKILIVNVASKCGFTPQYKELQAVHEKYSDNVVVLGFPCNQFGEQEPGNAEQIEQFCEVNFGVTFTLSEKIDVRGENQTPLYTWLTNKELNGVKSSSVKWNFQKYFIDEKGNLIDVFGSTTKPDSPKIINLIEG